MAKRIFLNEVSIKPLAQDFSETYKRISEFIKTFKAIPPNIFENRIYYDKYIGDIELQKDLNFQGFCNNPKGRTLGSLLLGLGRHPFIDSNSSQERDFMEFRYYIQKNESKVSVDGLAGTFLYSGIGISFNSEKFWEYPNITIRKESNNELIEEGIVFSASSPDHFSSPEFHDWKSKHLDLKIIECQLSESEKTIKLRDDHGKDHLLELSKKLIKLKNVVKIVNSLEYSPYERNFIKSINEKGLIEIVDIKTDEGFGLVVQSTGRTIEETRYIAKKIMEKIFT